MPVDVQPNQNFDILQAIEDFVMKDPKLAAALLLTVVGVWFLRRLLANRLAMTVILIVAAIVITVAAVK